MKLTDEEKKILGYFSYKKLKNDYKQSIFQIFENFLRLK